MGRVGAILIGGLLTFILGWIPILGPIGGGFVGGYLRGVSTTEGGIVGAASGLVASIPGIALAALVFLLGGIGLAAEWDPEAAGGFAILFGLFLVALAYMAGSAGVGGAIGGAISDREPRE